MTSPSEQREKELARSHNARMPSPFSTKVVGVTFTDGYPDNLRALREVMEGDEPLVAILIRNPDNAHDKNAIQVHVPALGDENGMIGHLTGPIAARMAPEMDDGERWAGEIESVLISPGHEDRPGISIRCARVREEEA
jgi:hypothetical protein